MACLKYLILIILLILNFACAKDEISYVQHSLNGFHIALPKNWKILSDDYFSGHGRHVLIHSNSLESLTVEIYDKFDNSLQRIPDLKEQFELHLKSIVPDAKKRDSMTVELSANY